jgi:hypothetical protein
MDLMPLKSAGQRIVVFGTLWLLLLPRPAHTQDAASIFTSLGKFVSGFDAGVVFVAPAGFIRSDVLEKRGELQQVGVALRNPKLGINVGFDVLTGFQAKEESLDLRGAVTALPTITKYFDTVLPSSAHITPSATLGFGIGLSQLQDARAILPQPTGSDRSVKLTGSGYHFGASLAFGASFGDVGLYVENSFRYTRFPSLDWTEDKSIVPPAGWPTSMDFWTGTLRIGIGIGAP